MVSGTIPKVLLFGTSQSRSRYVCNLLQERGLSASQIEYDDAPGTDLLKTADVLVCVLGPNASILDTDHVKALLTRARKDKLPALVWGIPDNWQVPESDLIDCLPANVSVDEVIGRLTALARYAPVMKGMEHELQRLQRLGRNLNRYFEEIDQEMRLAGRLQHDFLPRVMPKSSRLRFAQLYRPAVWVSGDIYDIFRIDDRHLGMFIADAMGHGTAAGLMTMFLRRTLVPTRLEAEGQTIVPTATVMRQLHDGLIRQDLPHAQFVTAAYAIINSETLDIRLARGGHPYPFHVDAAGEIREMRCEGGLLGVAGLDPEFSEYRGRLAPGDKVIFYTDGLENLFIHDRDANSEQAELTVDLHEWVKLDADGFCKALADYLDHEEGSLNPEDDITVVVAEVVE